MFSVRKHSPRAFTLVEMLVVMAIIGILVALLLPAVMSAMASAQRTRNGVDIIQIMQALEMYKSEKGSYPPCMDEGPYNSKTAAQRQQSKLYRHIITAYPKVSTGDIDHMFEEIADNLDQASCLVYWLSQTSEDTRRPFSRATQLRKFMDFDSKRLVVIATIDAETSMNGMGHDADEITIYHYKAPYSKETPYLYIDSASYASFAGQARPNGNQGDPNNSTAAQPAAGFRGPNGTAFLHCVRPYLGSGNVGVNPQGFQLFCAGLDGRYSSAASLNSVPIFPIAHRFNGTGVASTAIPYDDFSNDRDNQTNFTEGRRIEDFIP